MELHEAQTGRQLGNLHAAVETKETGSRDCSSASVRPWQFGQLRRVRFLALSQACLMLPSGFDGSVSYTFASN